MSTSRHSIVEKNRGNTPHLISRVIVSEKGLWVIWWRASSSNSWEMNYLEALNVDNIVFERT